jgi:hypothetical protein
MKLKLKEAPAANDNNSKPNIQSMTVSEAIQADVDRIIWECRINSLPIPFLPTPTAEQLEKHRQAILKRHRLNY